MVSLLLKIDLSNLAELEEPGVWLVSKKSQPVCKVAVPLLRHDLQGICSCTAMVMLHDVLRCHFDLINIA